MPGISDDRRLPYGFAKAEGLVIVPLDPSADAEDTALVLGVRGGTAAPTSLAEARRVLGRPFSLTSLSDSDFDRHLSEIYAGAGFSGETFAPDMPDEESLDDIAGDLPTTADLLDTDDDAPTIRLINGLIY